jgi:hypothetical protein
MLISEQGRKWSDWQFRNIIREKYIDSRNKKIRD